MSKNGIYIFLAVLALVIVAVIAGDFARNRPGKRPSNPFAYDMESLREVSEDQIMYRETRNFRLNLEKPTGIACFDQRLFVTGDQRLQVISLDGRLLHDISLPGEPVAVGAGEYGIFVSTGRSVVVLDHSGTVTAGWDDFEATSLLTSFACHGDQIFIADAGRRRVYRYNTQGDKQLEFEGKSSDDAVHGFIIPSGCFDLAINEFGDLWVVNPGKHALENYTFDGVLRGFWTAQFADVKGFSGCCNPAHFAFLPGGNFITSEKGVLRIKEYKPSGEFAGVVAAPSKFLDDGNVPDVAVDAEGRVYACDPDRKAIRIFEKL